jgi:alkaline phosphatase
MKLRISIIIFTITALFLFACNSEPQPKSPKNVILMIGDGMGTTQLYAGYIANKGHLSIDRCNYSGFALTYCKNSTITDSGAAGTAIATGFKTNLKMIGMTPDGQAQTSILKYAEQENLATGLVVSCAVTHATPAAFVANNEFRYNYEEIAYDYLKTDIDVFIGGGLDHFNKRKDGLNLVDSLKARNYQMAYSIDELETISSGKIAGLLYDVHPPYYSDGRGDMLKDGSLKAIEILNKNKNGFFMMVEGSQIDWAGHDNSNDTLVSEVIDFDRTIDAVLDFAEKDGETLVIITADHETGGYAIIDGDINEGRVGGAFTTTNHSAVMVPIFAYGPGAEAFTGIMENTDIFKKIAKAFKIKINN